MHRFFITNFSWDKDFILKDSELLHQIINVFRAKTGDTFIFFDGKTLFDFVYEIKTIEKKEIIFFLISKIEKETVRKEISLYQALPNKIQKIEYILQKWVEVGISHFFFFSSERSQKLMLSPNKEERLKSIMQEALEQCWGNIFPSLVFFDKNNFDISEGMTLFFHQEKEKNAKYLKDISLESEKINIIIGPEWGLSEKEVQIFREKGYIQSYLWANILRTETVSSVVSFYIGQK